MVWIWKCPDFTVVSGATKLWAGFLVFLFYIVIMHVSIIIN